MSSFFLPIILHAAFIVDVTLMNEEILAVT